MFYSITRKINSLLAPAGVRIQRLRRDVDESGIYDFDGLRTIHSHDFMKDPRFAAAYQRGVRAAGADYNWYWRVHIGIWAARVASRLDGDFVECGVNRGFLSSAIMHDLRWNLLDKTFYLLDTFSGLDEASANQKLLALSKEKLKSGFYVDGVESVRKNFLEWHRVSIIVGAVPATLNQIVAHSIAYLSLDMNHAVPEIEALEYLWPRLSIGAIVLVDDYAYYGYPEHRTAFDKAAVRLGVSVACLPTGQGLIIKPKL